MKVFHFHDWSKWVEYEEEFSDHIPPLTKNNWYGYIETWNEKWEKRECEICGKHQRRGVKGSRTLGCKKVIGKIHLKGE